MKTNRAELGVALQFFDDITEYMNSVGVLFDKAIGAAGNIPDSLHASTITGLKNDYIPLIDTVSEVIRLIYNTIDMILALDGYNGSDNLGDVFKLDDLNGNFYFYLKDDIVSLGNLDKTVSVNPDAEANILYIYSFMINNLGYTHKGAMAMLNNMGAESFFDSQATNQSSGAYGLCQWLDRKKDLVKFAEDNNMDYTSIDTQLLFMDHELKNRFNSGNEQHRLYDQVTGVLDVSGEWMSGNITKIYEAPVDPNDPDYVSKNQQVADSRYYGYNSCLEDFIDANNVLTRDVSSIDVSNSVSENIDTNNTQEQVDTLSFENDNLEVVDTIVDDSVYVIKSGDSLYSIAKANGITVEELYNKNKDVISNPNVIYPGLKIKL